MFMGHCIPLKQQAVAVTVAMHHFAKKKTMSIIVYDDYRVEYTLGTENISKS